MIRSQLFRTFAGLLLAAFALSAQPKPKSQKEYEAVVAVFNAQGPDARIAAANNLIEKFADTEFKATALFMLATAYQEKNDAPNTIIFSEKTLEADPKNFMAMIMIANGLAQRTREFDLDKEEKLTRAEKLANQAIELIKTAPKPNPQVTDEQWTEAKKDYNAQAYEALGLAASARKKYPDAVNYLKQAVESSSQPDQSTMVRLASAYNNAQQYDKAIEIADKVLAMQNVHPTVKAVATQEKAKAEKAKGGGK